MKRWKGSITVEAVFIIPLLIVVVMIFLWLTFFLHDRLVVHSAIHQTLECAEEYLIYGTALEGRKLSESSMINRGVFYGLATMEHEEKEQLEKYVESLLEDKLYLYRLEEISLEKTGFTLQLSMCFSCPLFWNGNAEQEEWQLWIKESRSCIAREELTRIGSNLIKLKDGEWVWK